MFDDFISTATPRSTEKALAKGGGGVKLGLLFPLTGPVPTTSASVSEETRAASSGGIPEDAGLAATCGRGAATGRHRASGTGTSEACFSDTRAARLSCPAAAGSNASGRIKAIRSMWCGMDYP